MLFNHLKLATMKKLLLVVVLAACFGLIAFASLRNSSTKNKKEPTEKKTDQPAQKKACKKTCWFS
jgi:hypothetical protein